MTTDPQAAKNAPMSMRSVKNLSTQRRARSGCPRARGAVVAGGQRQPAVGEKLTLVIMPGVAAWDQQLFAGARSITAQSDRGCR